jgi:hypothetical protein
MTLILLILYFSDVFKFLDLLKLFSGNRTIVLLFLPVLLALFHFLNFTNDFYTDESVDFGFWNGFIDFQNFDSRYFAATLILVNAILLNRIFNRSNFFDKITFLIAPCYVVFMSFFAVSFTLNGMLFAHFFFILMLQQFFELSQNESQVSIVFNILLFGGLAASFVPPLLMLLPFFLLLIRFLRPLTIRDVLVGLMASTLPFVYLFSIVYLLDSPALKVSFFSSNTSIHGEWFVVVGILSIASIMGFTAFLSQWQKSAIRSKRQFQMLLSLFLLLLFLSLFYVLSFQHIAFFSLLLLPLSLVLPFAFRSDSIGMATSGVFYLLLTFSVIKFFIFS